MLLINNLYFDDLDNSDVGNMRQELDELNENLGDILNNLGVRGDIELLATQTSTSVSTHTIKNITNYKFLYLVRLESTGNPCLCPVSLFKETKIMNTQTVSVSEDRIYGGQTSYISDTSVKMKVVSDGTVKLYGMK